MRPPIKCFRENIVARNRKNSTIRAHATDKTPTRTSRLHERRTQEKLFLAQYAFMSLRKFNSI
jgi:hypothetical protein